ncbi:Rossmann-fold NAD(P)-binding domain-containing protein [Marinobacter confluentis]|uniref:oxidoreductase n=1 Tax=Marinobacter confluentis TaxID=1697557 RepID=UPI00177F8C4E|nr:oxidoreductase [Marinobacter confluentis]
MKVLLLGATGLTGGMVLENLLAMDEVSQVVAPTRRALTIEHYKLKPAAVDFAHLEDQSDLFAVDVIICCLGTTIKKAGSRRRFREVDYGYAIKAAEIGRQQGAWAFILMSAVGASPSSPVFYNRIKGELEHDLKGLGYPCLSIYQPGLLLGERSEHRKAEALGIKAMPAINALLHGPLRQYRGIEAATVACAMANEALKLSENREAMAGVHYRRYEDMVALANSR